MNLYKSEFKIYIEYRNQCIYTRLTFESKLLKYLSSGGDHAEEIDIIF